jgi:hypothetical protein
MPAHNYMLDDLSGALKAIALFPIFLLFPGYAISWLLDLLDFRRRTIAFRVTFAIPLSIALCPMLTFALARYATFSAVWAFYSLTALVFCVSLALDLRAGKFRRPFWPSGSRTFAVILGIWLAICVLSLIDLQIGHRLYSPTSVFDYSVRTAFVHSISTTGVPPQNPFFSPGHPVPLRYHYFWLMMCSLVNQIGGQGVSARQAIIGGTFWIGVGLIALLAIYLRLFYTGPPERLHRRLRIGVALLAITGLDLLPSLFFWSLYARGLVPFFQPGVELWNEHVDWFLGTVVSTPHAIAALIACFMAFLLLWHSTTPRRGSIPAALALASAAGCSIWVVFVFALFLVIWTAITLYKRRYRETAALCVSGVLSILLAMPYLREIGGSGSGPGPGGPLIKFTVRAFSMTALVRTGGLSATWRLILLNGPLIPLNYLLEFGLFFLVARYKWKQHRAGGTPLSRQDLAMTIMAVVSTLVCTFLTSGIIGNNDLGWRGFLIAQFVLMVWAVDIFGQRESHAFLNPGQRQLLVVFFALGVAGTVTDLAVIRSYPVMADRGIVPPLDWMAPDRDLGRRAYAARTAYDWLHGVTPVTAAVQANPRVVFQDTLGMLYSDRRMVAGDLTCDAGFGGNLKECAPLVSRLQEIFPPKGASAKPGIQDVCDAMSVDVLVAKDTDSAWSDRASWVWRESPVYANRYFRLFNCPTRTAAR